MAVTLNRLTEPDGDRLTTPDGTVICATVPLNWKIYVDWDADFNFSGTYDDISADVKSVTWRLGMQKPYQLVADETVCQITVDNSGQKYTPENTGSDLSPNVKPHRRIRMIADVGREWTMWTGWLETIVVEWAPHGPQTGATLAVLICTGSKTILDDAEVQIDLYSSVQAQTIIAAVLEQVQLPPAVEGVWILGEVGVSELGESTFLGSAADYSDLETAITTFDNYGDLENHKAHAVITEVTEAERGHLFFARDGRVTFWNRHHFLLDTTVDGTVNSASGDYRPRNLDYNYGALLSNSVRVEAKPRKVTSSETLWELDTNVWIPENATKKMEIDLKRTYGQIAGATSLTASGAVYSQGTATITVTERGAKAILNMTNSGDSPAILTALTVSGAATIQQNSFTEEAQDVDSIHDYGTRNEINITLNAISSQTDALGIANFELARRKEPRGDVFAVEFRNESDGMKNAHQLYWGMGKRLTITADEINHSRDYFIIGEDHKWNVHSKVHETRFYLEPAQANEFWILGMALFTELGTKTKLGY